jgi:hypothetical protein
MFIPTSLSLEKILSCKQERKRERTGKKNERERDRKEKKNKAEDVLLGNVPNVRTHETGEWEARDRRRLYIYIYIYIYRWFLYCV